MGIMKAGRPTGRTKEHIQDVMEDIKGKRTNRVVTLLSDDEYAALRRFCFDKELKMSEIGREAISEYMEKHGG